MNEKNLETILTFAGITIGLVVIASVFIMPMMMQQKDIEEVSSLSLASSDYYSMFQCQCCGKPIDRDCCGMAQQGKKYLDSLLLDAVSKEEVMVDMVKKFGFNVLMDETDAQVVKEYLKENADENPPIITIQNSRFDFGTIVQSDKIHSTTFMLKNTGKSELIIENLDTSCMCTTAKIVFDGKEGPVFGMSMHGDNPEGYSLTIPAGQSAELVVMYDPMAHGLQKKPVERIVRTVTITSNDPVNFQTQVRFDLTQKAKTATEA
jgi:hypothetical protein